MNEDKVKVRICAADNCTIRMSSVDKDAHVLCPSHTGWQCSWEIRCDVCRDWPDSRMKDYMKLTLQKVRKNAYKQEKSFQIGSRRND